MICDTVGTRNGETRPTSLRSLCATHCDLTEEWRVGGWIQAAGKLKGFFYLFLNQLSTMQEIITGDKTGGREEKKRGGG